MIIFVKREEIERVKKMDEDLVAALNEQTRIKEALGKLKSVRASKAEKVERLQDRLKKNYSQFSYPSEEGADPLNAEYWAGHELYRELEAAKEELKMRSEDERNQVPALSGELEAVNTRIDEIRAGLGEYYMVTVSDIEDIPEPRRPSGLSRFQTAIDVSRKE